MEGIASRIKSVLKESGLNARNLAAMSHVHHTTIYTILRKGAAAKPHLTVQVSIEGALDTISKLVLDNKLPLPLNLSQEAKAVQLAKLVEQQSESE